MLKTNKENQRFVTMRALFIEKNGIIKIIFPDNIVQENKKMYQSWKEKLTSNEVKKNKSELHKIMNNTSLDTLIMQYIELGFNVELKMIQIPEDKIYQKYFKTNQYINIFLNEKSKNRFIDYGEKEKKYIHFSKYIFMGFFVILMLSSCILIEIARNDLKKNNFKDYNSTKVHIQYAPKFAEDILIKLLK